MKNITLLAAMALVAMLLPGCKLSQHRDVEDVFEKYTNKKGELNIGDYDKGGNYTMGGASLDPSLVKDLSIDWLNDTVSVVSYDGSTVEISEISADPLNDTTTMYYRLTPDGQLSVKFSKSGASLKGENIPSKHLFVRVPRGHRLDEIEINGAGHYISLDSVVCVDMELNSVSNYLILNECEVADNVTINTVNSLELVASFSKLPQEMEINSVGSSATLYVPEDAGIELEVNGLASDFRCELPVVRKGHKRVIGNGECKIECNSVCRQLNVKVKK
ncbi:MAG: hypothetical protein J6T03_07135 [Bacteroidales bacterium]|nr:hypothetical protein [Bacteroidales bacterium]